MTIKDHLLFMMETNQLAIRQLIDDISEEESMVQISNRFNHIRWQVGHIAYFDNKSLELFGGEVFDFTKWRKLFASKSELSNDPAVYPEMGELRFSLYDVHRKLIETTNELTDSDLERTFGSGDNEKPIWRPITFYCMHEFYHAGQITQIRRLLGRDRPFI